MLTKFAVVHKRNHDPLDQPYLKRYYHGIRTNPFESLWPFASKQQFLDAIKPQPEEHRHRSSVIVTRTSLRCSNAIRASRSSQSDLRVGTKGLALYKRAYASTSAPRRIKHLDLKPDNRALRGNHLTSNSSAHAVQSQPANHCDHTTTSGPLTMSLLRLRLRF